MSVHVPEERFRIVRVQSLTLVAASAALLAPTTLPAPVPHRPREEPTARSEAARSEG
ncbi:hypothetical protein G3I64_03210, partial [Streptomyces sp. SID8499]|nr:hypothetical protein [Streptomyces sp. SID8499]